MAEPKKRLTSTRSGKRQSQLKLKNKSLGGCPKCKSPIEPHRICRTCGFYRGSDLLKLEEKAQAKETRRKEREEAAKSEEKEK